jgi:hypothetical protein
MQLDQEAAEYFLIVVIAFASRAMGSIALLPWLAQRSTLSNLLGNSGSAAQSVGGGRYQLSWLAE